MSALRADSHAPTYCSWPWLLAQSIDRLEKERASMSWVRDAYAWRHARLPAEERIARPKPDEDVHRFGWPAKAFPVLAAHDGGGLLGLVRLSFGVAASSLTENGVHDSSRDRAGRAAVSTAVILLRPDDAAHPVLAWDDPLDRAPMDGDSVALSCFTLSVAIALGLSIPPALSLCASGGWDFRQEEFAIVAPETLSAKLRNAADWGFRRVMLVEGQTGWEDAWPEADIVWVSPAPAEAIPTIVAALLFDPLASPSTDPTHTDEALAKGLRVFDQRFVNGEPDARQLERTLSHTRRILEATRSNGGAFPLTRFLAHDMRSRVLLHGGDASRANEERSLAAKQCLSRLWPDGPLGLYLAYEIHAHHAMIAIDLGDWREEAPEHRDLDEAIERIEADARTRDRILMATYLRGTRAWRTLFLGRLRDDRTLLNASLADLNSHFDYAPRLADYAVGTLGLGNHGLRRRHNVIIEALYDFRVRGWEPPDATSLLNKLWPIDAGGPTDDLHCQWLARGEPPKSTPFDWAAWLKWRMLRDGVVDENALTQIVDRVERDTKASLYYPRTKAVETVIELAPSDSAVRARAKDLLTRAAYFVPSPENAGSILSLLAIRAATLLAWDETRPLPCPDVATHPDLHKLWRTLRALPPERRIRATPY